MAGDRYLDATTDLLDGWCGPVQIRIGGALNPVPHPTDEWADSVSLEVLKVIHGAQVIPSDRVPDGVRLDPHRPEVVALLLRWLHIQGKPAHHLRPDWLGGTLANDDAGDALAWSVRSVRAGGGVVRGIYFDQWRDCIREPGWITRGGGTLPLMVVRGSGWEFFGRMSPLERASHAGPETGDEGRACADRAALAAGFALRNENGTTTYPTLPEPPCPT